jgi:hypothetical protein
MLRAKRERSPKPMFLTHSLSGWHKEVAQNIPVADPSVTPKALEVSSFVGLLFCLALVHGLLLFEEGCAVADDHSPTRPKALSCAVTDPVTDGPEHQHGNLPGAGLARTRRKR